MPVTVPLLDLQAQYRPLRDELLAAMTRVADSQRFIMGPEITALETELSALIGVKHAITVSSGTDALLLALMALDIRPGDEVITPTYSFFATAGCVVRAGGRPVLVDIDPVTYNADVDEDGAGAETRHGPGGREERIGRRDHFDAGFDVERHQREQQRVGARRYGNRVADAEHRRHLVLERRDLRAHDEALAVADALDRREDLGAQRSV